MPIDPVWSDPDEHETNLQSGDVLYEAVIRHAWLEVQQWLGNEHVHRGRDGDGPLWPIASIEDHKRWIFYNSVSWNGEDGYKKTLSNHYEEVP